LAASALHLVAPGDLATATGGYLYDREILAGLAGRGWCTHAHALDASFPQPTPAALRDARRVFDALPARALVHGGGDTHMKEREMGRTRHCALWPEHSGLFLFFFFFFSFLFPEMVLDLIELPNEFVQV
jgi:hypothetical protein